MAEPVEQAPGQACAPAPLPKKANREQTNRKEVITTTQEWIEARRREAWALLRKGDDFGIARRFLIQFEGLRHWSEQT